MQQIQNYNYRISYIARFYRISPWRILVESTFGRLYAFGADAYDLVKQLGRLRAQHYAEFQGMTGTLSLNENNRIDRRLTWAKFIKGTPRIIDSESQAMQ